MRPGQDTGTVSQSSTETWTDRKRYLWLIGLVVPSLAFVAIAMHQLTDWAVWLWLGPVVILVIVPAIDLIAGLDRSNPPDDVIEALEKDKYYRWITYAFLPIQYAGFITAFYLISGDSLSMFEKVGLAISIGCIGGIGINTAHELGHKRENLERWLARITLAPAAYGHFYIEHNRGHHVRVATPEDPASSRLGESFYAFLPRSVWGSLKSAWHLEQARLARNGRPVWHWSNENLQAWAMTVLLFGALALWLGASVLPFLLMQAAIGFSLLEVVNFLEHYGLKRRKEASGRYERCKPEHSWNSNHTVTNLMLYHLQRHSDHHANPMRRYQALRHFEQAPQLPSGYAGMIVVAMIPPLWRSIMDPRVLAHYAGDVTRANIHPPLREKILARYGADFQTRTEA